MTKLPIEMTVEDLERFVPTDASVLSLYLLTDPTAGAGQNLHAQATGLLHELAARLGPESDAGAQVRAEGETVQRVIASLGTPPRSVAIFTSTARGFCRVAALPVRMPPGAFWGTAPYLRPLLAALDEHERTIVVLLDKERARFFRVFLGQIEEIHDFEDAKPKKHRQMGGAWAYPPVSDWTRGGWADSGIARREELRVQSHARRAATTLMRLADEERVDRVIVGGTPEVMSEFRRLVPKRLRRRVAAQEVHAPLFASPAEVRTAVAVVEEQIERANEERLVSDVLDGLGTDQAVGGPADVLDAAGGGRVHVLVFAETARLPGGRCERCGSLTVAPLPTACAACGGPVRPVADLVDDLAGQVLDQGGRVEEVRGAAAERLAPWGGIAALVRYSPW